jgi:hypothetical protein
MTIVHVTSPTLKRGVQYAASECCGKDLYRLTEIATAKDVEDKNKDWDVKIDVKIARQIRQIKPKKESFKDAVNRILADWLSCNHPIPGGNVMEKSCNP